MTPKTVLIAPEVELGELRAENDWLRNRTMILAQALQDAAAALQDAQAQLSARAPAEDPAQG